MVADFINFLSQSGTIMILVGYIFALWAALTIWSWFDISSRTSNILYRFGAIILVALGFLLGFVIYLVLRPSQTKDEIEFRLLEEKIFESQSKSSLCYNCESVVETEFSYCATCGARVRKVCNNCKREISHTWNVCPYCAHPQKEEIRDSLTEEVEPSAPITSRLPRFTFISVVKKIKIPNISLKRGGKKRGRPKKEKQEVGIKRPRGRPRKEITQVSSEA